MAKLATVSAAQHGGKCLGGWTPKAVQRAEETLRAALASPPNRAKGGRGQAPPGHLRHGAEEAESVLPYTSSALSWPYQTCTEFAFYQTCEVSGRRMPEHRMFSLSVKERAR